MKKSEGPDGAGHHLGAEITHQVLHQRRGVNQLFGSHLALGAGAGVAPGGAVRHPPHFHRQSNVKTSVFQRQREPISATCLVERLALHPQQPLAFVAGHELRLQCQLAHHGANDLGIDFRSAGAPARPPHGGQ